MRYTTHQAKTNLSRLLSESANGAEVVITKGKKPVARLVPYSKNGRVTRPEIGETTSKPFEIIEKREITGSVGDTTVYF